jgi:hypothetical protein
MTLDEIRKNVATETTLIGDTLQAIVSGQPADLTGFDTRVADLCLATNALPLQDAQALIPDFEKLAGLLDDLRNHMTQSGAAPEAAAPQAGDAR